MDKGGGSRTRKTSLELADFRKHTSGRALRRPPPPLHRVGDVPVM
jgi:hypothetical protein